MSLGYCIKICCGVNYLITLYYKAIGKWGSKYKTCRSAFRLLTITSCKKVDLVVIILKCLFNRNDISIYSMQSYFNCAKKKKKYFLFAIWCLPSGKSYFSYVCGHLCFWWYLNFRFILNVEPFKSKFKKIDKCFLHFLTNMYWTNLNCSGILFSLHLLVKF